MNARILLMTLLVTACWSPPPETSTAVVTKAIGRTPQAKSTSPTANSSTSEETIPKATTTDEPIFNSSSMDMATPTAFVWPTPMVAKAELSRDRISDAERETFALLSAYQPQEKDDVALAFAYQGLTAAPETSPPESSLALDLGTRQRFRIRNLDANKVSEIEAILMAVSERAYFWFDTSPGLIAPTMAQLDSSANAFDEIYSQTVTYFGSEDNPGIDGDPRIHIVHASPLTLCDIGEDEANQCHIQGFFSLRDTIPASAEKNSNEREMFVMNGSYFGSDAYFSVLAHEFRHMIEANYDRNDVDWEVEGSAMLAKDLLGFAADPITRANRFMANPDQQLNRWTDGNTTAYYGQSYLFNRYIFDRLGPALYRQFATHSAPGFTAIDDIAREQGLPFDGYSIWLDWLAALAIHDEPGAPEKYHLPVGIEPVAMELINLFPMTVETKVNQYAADYYRIDADGQVTLDFTGSNHARLLEVLPTSGDRMWLADRANFSDLRLTREFDLTGVDRAKLNYQVHFDIERGYDFAYLSISIDGGQTWQALATPNMKGVDSEDNPGNIALTDRFYTGQNGGWQAETADLTPFTGRKVQIRFEYVTDPILTFSGIALDNISIPEIGFYDGAELDVGWEAEGFVRATGYVPQRWSLQLINFSDEVPELQHLTLEATNTLSIQVPFESNRDQLIMIVAASAPMTLQPAHYRLEVRQG